MTLYYDDNAGTDRFSLQDFEPSFGLKLNNAVREAWLESYGPVLTDAVGAYRRGDGPKISAQEARDRIAASGLKIDLSPRDNEYTQAQIDFLLERQRELVMIRDVRERTPWDLGSVVRGGAMFGAGILDPINLATAFVPWTRAIPAAQGLRAATLSTQLGTRTLGRAGVGSIDAGISTAALEPFYYGLRQNLGDDYDGYDAMANIAFGTLFGGGVHTVGGAGVDAFRRAMGRALPSDAYAGLSVDQIQLVQGLRAEIADGMDLRDVARVLETYTPEMRRAAGFPDAPAAAVDPVAPREPAVDIAPPARTADEIEVPQTSRRNDLAAFIRDTGGLAPDLARDAGGENGMRINRMVPGLVKRDGAQNYDELTERMIENGFLPEGMDSGSAEAIDMVEELVARALNGERILRLEDQVREMELRARQDFDDADRDRFEAEIEERMEREAIQADTGPVFEDPTADEMVLFADPETREAALRTAVAQSAEGREIDIDAIMNTDEMLGATAGQQEINDAAARNRRPEAIRVADFDASAEVDARNATAPKWQALTDAEAAEAEAAALLADTVKAGDQAFKYSRGEAPGQKKATLWQGTTARFSPEDGAPLGRFRWDFINSEGGEQAQAFGYGHYLAQQAWISQTRYRERLIGRKRESLDRYTIPDGEGGVMTLSRRENDAAWQMPDGTIVHASQKDPKLAAMADAVAQVDRYGYARARETFENLIRAAEEEIKRQGEKLAEYRASSTGDAGTDAARIAMMERGIEFQRVDAQRYREALAALDDVTVDVPLELNEPITLNGRVIGALASGKVAGGTEFNVQAKDGKVVLFMHKAPYGFGNKEFESVDAAMQFLRERNKTLATGIKKYDPPQPENLRERVVAGSQEITGDLADFIAIGDQTSRELAQTLGLSLDEVAARLSGVNVEADLVALLDNLIEMQERNPSPKKEAAIQQLQALQARGITSATIERPGSLYRSEMDVEAFQNLMLWDAPLSEQPAKVREAFERWGIAPEPVNLKWDQFGDTDWYANYTQGVVASGVRVEKRSDGFHLVGGPIVAGGNQGPFASLQAAKDEATARFSARYGLTGKVAYAELQKRIDGVRSDRTRDWGGLEDDVKAAIKEISARRGDSSWHIKSYRDDEVASVMLHNAGIPGHAFLDGVSRGATDAPAYNIVIYSDDAAKIVDRYARQTGEIGRATDTPEGLTEALRLSFGRDTDRLIEAGRIRVVATPADIPGGPHPGDVKAATAPDGMVYVVAQNVSELEARGIVLHEVGVHVGMEQMLGPQVFGEVLAQLDDAIARGESWAQAARAAVPADTLPAHVREEQLAYLVQNAPDLPIVQRILAAVRAWAYRNFEFARERMTLTEADFRAMAVSALHAAARGQDVPAGQGAMAFARDVAQTGTKAFRDWFGDSKVVDAEGKPMVVYHGTRNNITAFDSSKVKSRFPSSEGFYFTSRSLHASGYADGIDNLINEFDPSAPFAKPVVDGANVMPVYVSLQNPKLITVSEWGTLESAVDGDGGSRVRAAREAGHDGVIVKRRAGDEYDGDLVIAFRPEQIKSAIGNRGTFDPTNPDIRYSRGPIPDPSPVAAEMKRYDEAVKRAKSYAGVLRAAADKLDDDAQATAAMRAAMPDITPQEIDDLLTGLRSQVKGLRNAARTARSMLDAENQAGIMQSDAMRAADMLANNLQTASVIEKRNAALNMNVRLKATSFVNQFRDKGLDFEGFAALLVGSERVRQGSRVSIDAEYKGFRGEWVGGMIADVERAGLMREFISGTFDRDIYDALWRMGTEKPDMAGLPKQAVQLAEIVNKYQTDARNTRNRFGSWIRDLQGYITRQSHDMYRIREVTDAEWIDFVKDKIDLPKMQRLGLISETDPIGSLRAMYDDFAAGVHMKPVPAEEDGAAFGRGSNLARRESASRTIYFKDGLAAYEYNQRFGVGRLAESVLFGLDHAARSTALLKNLGTNPEATLTRLMDEYEASLAPHPERRSKFRGQRQALMNMLAQVDGSINIPGSVTGAKIGAFLRAWQSMAKLGGAMISSFSDLAGYGAELRYAQGKGLLSGVADGMGSLLQGRASGEKAAITSSLGVFHESMAGAITARFDSPDLVGGKMAAAMQMFFRLNGLNWWTETLRDGAALTHSHYMATQAGKPLDQIDPELRRLLGLYNIDAGKWDLLRMGQLQQADGRMYLTPEGLRTVPRAAYENYIQQVGRTVNDATVQNLMDDLAQALRVMAIDRAHHAVLEPSARTRAFMLRGTKPGTVPGEILRYIGQFKSFSIAMAQTVLGREVYGRGYDTLGEYLRKGHGDMLGLAYMVGLYSLLGYGAMAAKDLLKGRTPRDPLDYRTLLAAMAQGGGLGLYGDFLFGEYNRMGRTFTASLAGPVIGNADTILDLWTRVRNGDDSAAAAFKALIDNTPFMNLFWARPILDYLVLFHIQEALNPGFLRRMEKRIERDNSQTFILPPSQVVR